MANEHRQGVSRVAVLDSAILAIACLITFMLVTDVLTRLYHLSRADDLIGGLWAVIATVFVFRDTYQHSVSAAVTRIAATGVSLVLCLAYLAFLPFRTWALPVLIGLSVLVVYLIGRPGDAATAAITTAVVLVASAVSPQHPWQQPILRLADTVIGVAVGVAAAWLGLRVTGQRAGAEPVTGTTRPLVSGAFRTPCRRESPGALRVCVWLALLALRGRGWAGSCGFPPRGARCGGMMLVVLPSADVVSPWRARPRPLV